MNLQRATVERRKLFLHRAFFGPGNFDGSTHGVFKTAFELMVVVGVLVHVAVKCLLSRNWIPELIRQCISQHIGSASVSCFGPRDSSILSGWSFHYACPAIFMCSINRPTYFSWWAQQFVIVVFFVSVFPHVLPILTLSLYDCNFRSPPGVSSVFWFKRSILACQPETKTRFPTQDPLVPRDLEEHVPMPYRQK